MATPHSYFGISQRAWRWLVFFGLLLAIFLPRLASLGSILTVDEPLWRSRGDTFIQAFSVGNFSRTLVAGQPGVTTAWLVGLAAFRDSLATDQAAIALTTSLLVLCITYFAVRLWGFAWGMLVGFLLALDPFLIAHSRRVHTDALMALFYLSSLMALLPGLAPLYFKKYPIWRYIVYSAVLGAGALLTKMFALILLPTVAFIVLFTVIQTKTHWQTIVKITALWGGVFVLTVYALWPALWTNLPGVNSYLFERVAIHSEGTRGHETTSIWWYYAREAVFRFTVVTTLLLPFTLVALVKEKSDLRRSVGYLLFSALLYAVTLSISSDKSDRYILFSIITLAISSILGLRFLSNWLQKKWPNVPYLVPIVFLVVVGFLAADAARIHPYYLAHYNQLYFIEEDHKLGWGEGLEQAAQWVHEQNPHATVASYYPRVTEYFYDGEVVPFNHAENKNYLILYRAMMERGPEHIDTEVLQEYLYSGKYQPEKIITINNLPYVWIFKLN